MQQDSVPQMSGYKEFKTYKRFNSEFEILWPIEISEDILFSILAFVEENMRISEINENFCKVFREKLDRSYGGCWNVFIGKSFGADAIHDTNNFIYFKYRSYYFLIYKTTV